MAFSTQDSSTTGIERDETFNLIASDKVEGTKVFDLRGDHIGNVHNFMVDKVSGDVAYAVISFGGFLGIGESYFPLPWKQLSYDTEKGGYVVDIDRNRLEAAPDYKDENSWVDPSYRGGIDDYWARPFSL